MRTILSTFFLLVTSLVALAQTPRKFNYQAVVRNNSGTIVANQGVSLRFSIHDATANGTVQYSERHTATTNAFGLVNLQVGGGTVVSGLFTDITWGAGAKFLQVEADITGGTSYTTLGTMELISVPYALQADKAGSFTGTLTGDVSGTQAATLINTNAVTTTKIADNAITTAKITDAAVTGTKLADASVVTTKVADFAITNNKIADDAISTTKLVDNAVSAGKVADNAITGSKIAAGAVVKSVNGLNDAVTIAAGTGTSLSVAGNTITIDATGAGGDITGVTAGAGLNGGGTAGAIALSAAFGGSGGANTVARSDHNHLGQSWDAATGNGLFVSTHSATGTSLAGYTDATDFNAAGIIGYVTANSGQSVGVYGATNSSAFNAAGIYGQANRDGSAAAVMGVANGANSYAILGFGSGANSWAGFFQGKVHVNGTLSKAAGSFKIDHPLDPQNKYLSHSFVESPDMMNVYNGNVVLDSRGEATIKMPDYFEALNKDFRYQLTAMGKPSPGVYISQEITGNTFRIAGGAPNGKISWMVTGIRHDTYANEHRIPVEEQKPAAERGTLLNGDSNSKRVYGTLPGAIRPRNIAPSSQPN